MFIWMLVTKDKYELPIAVFDTARELAEYVGLPVNSVLSAISKCKKRGHKCRYVRIKVNE